ncbi:MAG: hypothetical protein H5T97_02180 [Firmicutes bacterium]|nr:hypothetical protein [Bacillota bacterium]
MSNVFALGLGLLIFTFIALAAGVFGPEIDSVIRRVEARSTGYHPFY